MGLFLKNAQKNAESLTVRGLQRFLADFLKLHVAVLKKAKNSPKLALSAMGWSDKRHGVE